MGTSGVASYITPRGTDGVDLTTVKRRGVYTLSANTTYYFIFGGGSSIIQHIHLTTYTAGMVITSATIQTCSQRSEDVSHVSTVVGEWISETPAGGTVSFTGAGWSVTNSVITSLGSALGGASWQLIDWSPDRTRLEVVVGATGGDIVVAWHGKE
jgi:hypothetical protein